MQSDIILARLNFIMSQKQDVSVHNLVNCIICRIHGAAAAVARFRRPRFVRTGDVTFRSGIMPRIVNSSGIIGGDYKIDNSSCQACFA